MVWWIMEYSVCRIINVLLYRKDDRHSVCIRLIDIN